MQNNDIHQNSTRSYFVGVSWFILSLFSSSINDIISKYAGLRLHSVEVAFFRFIFSTMTLIPFIIFYGKESVKTQIPWIHLIRGGLLFFGMTSWTYAITLANVTTATIISFSIPLFVLVLASIFLNERIIWQRWVVTIVGFCGIAVTLDLFQSSFESKASVFFILAAIAFAMIDVINKKIVVKESMLSMLFYSSIVTAVLACPASFYYWQTPTIYELILLFILGCSANLILFFILKSFALLDATAIAPYRYLELIISACAAYFVFGELPTINTIYGALIIVPSTLFIIYSERKYIVHANE